MAKLAFEKSDRGFTIRAFWGEGGDSRVEITRDGKPHKIFSYPSYKIFNLAAHFSDIVDGELANNDDGYRIAGSDGLGGGIMPEAAEQKAKEKP